MTPKSPLDDILSGKGLDPVEDPARGNDDDRDTGSSATYGCSGGGSSGTIHVVRKIRLRAMFAGDLSPSIKRRVRGRKRSTSQHKEGKTKAKH